MARYRNYCVSSVGVEVGGFDGSTIIRPLSPPETTLVALYRNRSVPSIGIMRFKQVSSMSAIP
jgi:hypothetical protein